MSSAAKDYMQTENLRSFGVQRRGSAFRTFVIMGALVPAWHSIGMDLFNRAGGEALAAAVPLAKSLMLPYPSAPVDFQATAYCESGVTKSGAPTEYGIVAADPSVLPIGSWIHVEGPIHRGIFHVMDTGRLIKGKIIDIYVPGLKEAVDFGRQRVQITVLKYGSARSKRMILLN